jgi:SAM-dependent methyltransferase
MKKTQFLELNSNILKNKVVLDLACHDGESTKLILKNGAKKIYAVDIRDNLIQQAKENVPGNVDFFVGDITDPVLICPLVTNSETVTCFGVFYHLFDHFRFLSHILKPHVEHVLIETLFGPETANPEMFWGFEETDSIYNGYAQGCSIIPHGTPNLSWIINSAKIFGFECDWVHCYGVQTTVDRTCLSYEEYLTIRGESWPAYNDIISETTVIPDFVTDEINQMLQVHLPEHRRIILRLYNSKLVNSVPLDINDIYKWPY